MKIFKTLSISFLFTFLLITVSGSQSVALGLHVGQRSMNEPKVVIVSLPRVTWKTLSNSKTPNINKLIRDGSVASFSTKTASSTPTLESAYASISAGSRAYAASPSTSTFYSANEMVGSRNAADIFKRERGKTPSASQSVAIGFESTLSRNLTGRSPADIGGFSRALSRDNKTIGVFGNADFCQKMISSCNQRAIGYLGANEEGILSYGNVSRELLEDNLMLDMKNLQSVAKKSVGDNEVTAVECSDLERLENSRKTYSQIQFDQFFANAIYECDKLIGSLVPILDLTKDRIYVISPASPLEQEQLTMFVSAGAGIEPGYSSSGITRREGIVALGDIAPTILDFYSVKAPDKMVTTLIESKSSSDSITDKEQRLIQMNQRALSRDSSFSAVAMVFGLLAFSTILISILALNRFKKLRTLAKWLMLIVLSFPAATYLMLPLMEYLSNSPLMVGALALVCFVFSGICFYVGEKTSNLHVVLIISGFNIVLLVLDILTGAQLQLNTIFGYSTIVAGRYAGYGNMAFSILSISSILFVACIKQLEQTDKRLNKKWLNHALLMFMVAILVIDGAPFFGSDVGGVLAFTPTVFVISMLLYEKRLGIRSIFISAFLTLSAITIFSVVDLNRPISERTHLGRFVETLFNGQAGIVIERKLVSSLEILTYSTLSSVIIIGTLISMFLFFHPERYIKALMAQHPFFRFLVTPGLVLAILGLLLNDSGAAIPGMMLSIALPASMLILYFLESEEKTSQSSTTLAAEKV